MQPLLSITHLTLVSFERRGGAVVRVSDSILVDDCQVPVVSLSFTSSVLVGFRNEFELHKQDWLFRN